MTPFFLTPATQVVNLLMPTLLSLIPDDVMQRGLDKLLDVIEEAVAASGSQIDDALVLPLIAGLRAKFDIPEFADE